MQISCSETIKNCIITIHTEKISSEVLLRLKTIIEQVPEHKELGLNLQCVQKISLNFLNLIKTISSERGLALIELQNDVYLILNLTKYNKFVDIYLKDKDFIEQKMAVKNREFKLIQNNYA